MLTIQIDHPEIEQELKQAYDKNELSQVFTNFLLEKRIKSDVEQSLVEFEQNEVFSLEEVMQEARTKYE